MATYAASPFAIPGLQSYLVKGVAVDEIGKVNTTGTTGSAYTCLLYPSDAADHPLWAHFVGRPLLQQQSLQDHTHMPSTSHHHLNNEDT